MSWTPEQLVGHNKFKDLLGIKPAPAPVPKSAPVTPIEQPIKGYTFVVPGPPVGKPRMTQRDKWQKRPRVLRYRDYCDRIRAAAKFMPEDVYGVVIQAYIALPESWSKKKKVEYHGSAHRAKPDYDNISKSVGDALFKDDSVLAGGTCWKYWCSQGEERTVIRVLYDD